MDDRELDPPTCSLDYEDWADENRGRAISALLELELSPLGDSTPFFIEQLPSLHQYDQFRKLVLATYGGRGDTMRQGLLSELGALWMEHIDQVIVSDSFQDQAEEMLQDLYEPDPDYGRGDA